MGGELSDSVSCKTNYLLANKVGSIFYKVAALEFGTEILQPSWITGCWENQQLLSTHGYKLLPFTGCIISVTGLRSNKRKKIQDLTCKNGGEYSPDLTRKCTHLLSEQPRGLKYTYALDWGVHCVQTNWFQDSIKKSACQDESLYYLPEPSKRDLLAMNTYQELNRLSPTLRRKHLTQIQKRNKLNPRYGLVVITNSPKLNPIEDDPMEETENFFSEIKREILNDSTIDTEKKNEILSLIDKMNSNEDIQETIQKLIELCDKVIEHYKSISDKDKNELKRLLGLYTPQKYQMKDNITNNPPNGNN